MQFNARKKFIFLDIPDQIHFFSQLLIIFTVECIYVCIGGVYVYAKEKYV